MDALKGLLKGKKALVTGGAVNIGRAVALALAGAGADVAVIYQNSEEAAAEVISRIEAQGRRGLALKADITREEEVGAAFSRLSGDWGSLDILVNNSGIFSISPQAELSLEEWDRIWKVNMGGLFLCCREAFSLLPRGGSVVNLASINAFHPGFGETVHYDASKGGVMAYTRSLAAEWAPPENPGQRRRAGAGGFPPASGRE